MGMKELKDEISRIAKSAWIPTAKFIDILTEQKGHEIKLQKIGEKAIWVKLLYVDEKEATFESSGTVQKLPISQINCFTTVEEWYCQKKH
jgi:N12 class adenine-specific DNA methylase